MPFPLLRLPLLASMNVIKNIIVTDIINLIKTSTKLQRLVKISKYPVQLHVCPKSITLKHPMNPEKLQVLIVVRSDSEEHQDGGVCTKWKKEIERYRRIIDCFVEQFTVKSISFEQRDHDCEVFFEKLEYSKSRGLKLDKVRVWNGTWKEEMNERILSVCSDASELNLKLKCSQNFTFNGFHEFKMDKFEVYLIGVIGGEWFTADHMCALINCCEVIVKNIGHWKAVDINRFLKFWIKSTGRLRTVHLFAWRLDFNCRIAMNGINNIELRPFSTFQIQRDDGINARVKFSKNQFSLNVIDN